MPSTVDPCGPGKPLAPVRSINIRTSLPGPKTLEYMTHYAAHASNAVSMYHLNRPLVAKAHGALVTDVDGNIYIDFNAPTMVAGHTPYGLTPILQAESEATYFTSERITDYSLRLCERLNTSAPIYNAARKTLLAVTKGEAVEWAIKAAQKFTGRNPIIDLRQVGEPTTASLDAFRSDLAGVAGILLQPFGGLSGSKKLSASFIQELNTYRQNCGFLLIIDEADTFPARTGKLFGSEQVALQPDLIIVADSLASGLPISAVIGRTDVIDALPEFTPNIFSLACVGAISTLGIVDEQAYGRRVLQIEAIIRERVAEWQSDLPRLQGLEGIGALLAMQVDTPAAATGVVKASAQRGLLLPDACHEFVPLRFPLMVPEEQLNEGLDMLELALYEVLSAKA